MKFFMSLPGALALLAIGWFLGEVIKANHWFGF